MDTGNLLGVSSGDNNTYQYDQMFADPDVSSGSEIAKTFEYNYDLGSSTTSEDFGGTVSSEPLPEPTQQGEAL